MKKIIIALLIAALTAPACFAGDIGNIIGVDMMMGMLGGAAMGVAFATPSYMDGGPNADPTTFFVGAGWGTLAGAILGLGYGIYGAIEHINMRSKSMKAGYIDSREILVEYNNFKNGIQLTKKF